MRFAYGYGPNALTPGSCVFVPGSPTYLNINVKAADGTDLSPVLNNLSAGSMVSVQHQTDQTKYCAIRVQALIPSPGGQRTLQASTAASSGTLQTGDPVFIDFGL